MEIKTVNQSERPSQVNKLKLFMGRYGADGAVFFTILGLTIYVGILGLSLWAGYSKDSTNGTLWHDSAETIAGFVGTIFSLCGILAFYSALTDQQNALDLQRRELQKTIEEMERARKVYEQQRFENTFFNLLHNQMTVTNELSLHSDDANRDFHGRACFRYIWERACNKVGKNDIGAALRERYQEKYWKVHASEISHYFNNFHRLLEYAMIAKPEWSEDSAFASHEHYIQIVLDQLSLPELKVILLHYKSHLFAADIYQLIDAQILFKHLKNDQDECSRALLKLRHRIPRGKKTPK